MLLIWRLSALVALTIAPVAIAADVEAWQYRGDVEWTHPDGATIDGTVADTRVDNDTLRLLHEESSGRFFLEMTLIGSGEVADPAHFFVLDRPSTSGARKTHQIAASVLPGDDGVAGSIVSELSERDLERLTQYSGNFMGATYVLRTSQDPTGSWKTYYFLGEGFARALEELERDTRQPVVPPKLSTITDEPLASAEPAPEVSAEEHYDQLADAACFGDAGSYEDIVHAAEVLGNPVAMAMMGLLLSPGADCDRGTVPESHEYATVLYESSAELGYSRGMYLWGITLMEGVGGVSVDDAAGVYWLGAAMDAGSARAAMRIIPTYASGEHGTHDNRDYALPLLSRAEDIGILSEGELNFVRTSVEAALDGPGVGQGEGEATTGADTDIADATASATTLPVGNGGSGAEKPDLNITSGGLGFRVRIHDQGGGPTPRMGDVTENGSLRYTVVYIAQMHARRVHDGNPCWKAQRVFMLGEIIEGLNEYAADTATSLIESSASHSASLAEGVAFFETVPSGLNALPNSDSDYQNPSFWNLTDARGWGPRCSFDDNEHLYPAPALAVGN